MKETKLKSILTEIFNTFQVTAVLKIDRKAAITNILDEIRAIKKITIVRNITPEEGIASPGEMQTHIVTIKFITRGDAQKDLIQFKNDMLTSDFGGNVNDMKVEGLKFIEFKPKTLRRI